MTKCPYCAEEIQDAAILCRFCGARKTGSGDWNPPAGPAPRIKSRFTMLSAGGFFILSALIALITVSSPVPLLGAMRSGPGAFCYNLLFALLFMGMGIGLIMGRTWGYQLVMIGTGAYTIDRFLFLLDKSARSAYLGSSSLTNQLVSGSDMRMLDTGVVLAVAISLLCWWGFAIYVHIRRDYFR